jgi:hypothetical protein
MTHPINMPRGSWRAEGEAPPPIEHVPAGGCQGTKPPKRLHPTCLTCQRFGVGGVQIDPVYVTEGLTLDCDDWVHGDVNVLPLAEQRQPAKQGGLCAAPYGDPSAAPPSERDESAAGPFDELQLQYVLSLPTREERGAYLERVVACEGQAAADRLRAAVRRAWFAPKKPRAPGVAEPAAAVACADAQVNGGVKRVSRKWVLPHPGLCG